MEFPNAFLGREIWEVVSGREARPVAVEGIALDLVALVAWIKKDGMGLSALARAIDESIIGLLTSCTSNQIWKRLKIIHDQQDQKLVHHVHENFYKCVMDDGDMVI